MYKLSIFKDCENSTRRDFGLTPIPKIYYLSDSDSVCKVIQSLSHLKYGYMLEFFELDNVESVLSDFSLKEVPGSLQPVEFLNTVEK